MSPSILFFFFNDTATTEIYTLSLHDALPICGRPVHLLADSPDHGGMTIRPPDGFPLPELVLVSNRVLTEEAEALRAAMEHFGSAAQPGSPWTQDDEAVADRADAVARGRAA